MTTPEDQKLIDYFKSRDFPDTFYRFDTFTFTDSLQRYIKTNLVLMRYENQMARQGLLRLKVQLETRMNKNHP